MWCKKSSHRHEQQGEAEVAWKRGASNLKRHQIASWICFPTLIFCPPCNCCPIYLSGAPPRKAGAQKTRQTANSRITMSTSERGKGRHGGARDEEERRNVQLARQIGRPDGQRSRRRRAQMLDSFTKRSPIKPPFHAPRR